MNNQTVLDNMVLWLCLYLLMTHKPLSVSIDVSKKPEVNVLKYVEDLKKISSIYIGEMFLKSSKCFETFTSSFL